MDTILIYEGSVCTNCVINVTEASYFALPRSPASNQTDILCEAVHTIGQTENCLNLSNHCGGAEAFRSTIYSYSLEVCGNPEEVCFSNVTREMNNTKLHFFISESNACSSSLSGVAQSRLYIGSYNLITQGISLRGMKQVMLLNNFVSL